MSSPNKHPLTVQLDTHRGHNLAETMLIGLLGPPRPPNNTKSTRSLDFGWLIRGEK